MCLGGSADAGGWGMERRWSGEGLTTVINRRVATLIEIQAIAERRAAVACGCAMRVPERRRVVLYTSLVCYSCMAF